MYVVRVECIWIGCYLGGCWVDEMGSEFGEGLEYFLKLSPLCVVVYIELWRI